MNRETQLVDLTMEADRLLVELGSMHYGNADVSEFKNKVINLANKVYSDNILKSKIRDIKNVTFVLRVGAAGEEDPSCDVRRRRNKFDKDKEKMSLLIKEMMCYIQSV